MNVDRAALCKRAVKLETKELRTIRMDPVLILSLQVWFLELYELLLPKPSDYEHRKTLVVAFNNIAADCFGKRNGFFPVVQPFGSFVMDLFTAESDLDLSINFSSNTIEYPRAKKVSELQKFTSYLYKLQRQGHISKLSPVLQARVPVVKVVDYATGIECDVSAENKNGVSRTSILAIVSSIDGRFRLLSFLMKAWAKAHDINSSKDRTMNSLTIISLVAFHLQTRDPPILPPFSALFKDGSDVSSVQNAAVGFKHFGRRNEESIAELFVTLLIKLSAVKTLWRGGLCASIYEGTWIKKKWGSRVSNMNVEDFLDRSQNFARAVGKEETEKIYECIRGSLRNLSHFMEGQMEEAKLKEHLFRTVIPIPIGKSMGHKRSNPLNDSAELGPVGAKRARHMEAMEVRHDVSMAPNDLASDPPTFPYQPSSQNLPPQSSVLHHGHRSQYGLSLPYLGYASPYFSELPFGPRADYGSWHSLLPPAAPYLGFRPDYRPQIPLPPQFGHGIGQHEQSFARNYLPDRNLVFPENRDSDHDRLLSAYSSLGLQRPQRPYRS